MYLYTSKLMYVYRFLKNLLSNSLHSLARELEADL